VSLTVGMKRRRHLMSSAAVHMGTTSQHGDILDHRLSFLGALFPAKEQTDAQPGSPLRST
jgi:hypothetical protein